MPIEHPLWGQIFPAIQQTNGKSDDAQNFRKSHICPPWGGSYPPFGGNWPILTTKVLAPEIMRPPNFLFTNSMRLWFFVTLFRSLSFGNTVSPTNLRHQMKNICLLIHNKFSVIWTFTLTFPMFFRIFKCHLICVWSTHILIGAKR